MNGDRIALLHCQKCGRTWKQYAVDGEKFPGKVGCFNCRRNYVLTDHGDQLDMKPEATDE